MVYCVGLTGNIASGKTTVATIFSKLGIPVLSADQIAKELTEKNNPAWEKIIDHFGQHILLNNDQINRSELRHIIFTRPKEREWLENLLHPMIRQQLKEQIALIKSPYCVVEIPLHIDRELYPWVNKILLVCASEEVQITRIVKRDSCSAEQATAIIKVQPALDLRIKNADNIITNNSDFNTLQQAVTELHYYYLQESEK